MADGFEAQLEGLTQENTFMKKYLALRNKCEQLQQANEKLVNRLHHVKKMVRRYKRERKFLASRLEEHSDRFLEAQVPVMWEEDQLYSLLKPQPPVASPGNMTQNQSPTGTTKAKPVRKQKSGDQSAANSISPQQSPDKSAARMMSSWASLNPLYLAHGAGQPGPPAIKRIKKEKETPPRKPTNAFLMFCDQYRQAIQEEYIRERNELISQQELTKRLALRWNSLLPEDKKVYYDMFEIQKRQYDLEQRELLGESTTSPPDVKPNIASIGVPLDLVTTTVPLAGQGQ